MVGSAVTTTVAPSTSTNSTVHNAGTPGGRWDRTADPRQEAGYA